MSVQDRQRAADIVLRESDPSLDPGLPAVARCVNDFNPRQGGPPDAVTTVANAHARAIGQMSENDTFLRRMSEEAQKRGWSLESAVDRARLVTLIRASEPEAVPLQGFDLIEQNRLGGQFHALRAVAKKLDLDLSRASERNIAEAHLWKQRNRSVADACCFDEAMAASARRLNVRLSESNAKKDCAVVIFKERPDLISIYGSGTKPPVTEPTPPTSAEAGAELLRLTEAEIRERGLDPLSDRDRLTATNRVLRKNPRLAPDYTSKGRA